MHRLPPPSCSTKPSGSASWRGDDLILNDEFLILMVDGAILYIGTKPQNPLIQN
jgi:hypothetical protein